MMYNAYPKRGMYGGDDLFTKRGVVSGVGTGLLVGALTRNPYIGVGAGLLGSQVFRGGVAINQFGEPVVIGGEDLDLELMGGRRRRSVRRSRRSRRSVRGGEDVDVEIEGGRRRSRRSRRSRSRVGRRRRVHGGSAEDAHALAGGDCWMNSLRPVSKRAGYAPYGGAVVELQAGEDTIEGGRRRRKYRKSRKSRSRKSRK